MADYYPLIARAIEGLADKSPTVRRAVYDRARQALVTQLRSLDPPASSADIERERASLDLAIGAVEANYVLPAQQSHAGTDWPQEPSQTLLEPVGSDDAPPVRHEAPHIAESRDAPDAEAAPAAGDEDRDGNGTAAPERPRIGSRHHSSGQANRVRAIILVASILAVVVSIASWKLYNHEIQNETQPVAEQPAEGSDNVISETGKFTERLGGEVAPSPQAAEGATETVAVQRAHFVETDPATMQLPPNQQKLIASGGVVRWRLEQQDAGPGRPLETVVRADAEFPDNGFKLGMTIRKSTDGSAFSHTIDLIFSQASGDQGHEVVAAAILQAKDQEEEVRGSPLIGMMMPVMQNVFTIGLSDISSEAERNALLLQEKAWFDLMVTFRDGRSGRIIIEKGPTGFQTINEAFRSW